MDQPKQPQGQFTINLNFRRNTNSNAPAMTGRISAPEAPEQLLSFDAFEHVGEKGRYWIGQVDPNQRSLRQSLASGGPARGTHFIAIRENTFKVFALDENGNPNPAYEALSPEDRKKADSQPAFWATWTRGATDKEIRAAAWEREPSRYGPWASGSTQYPLPDKDAQLLEIRDPNAEVGRMLDAGEVSRGMPAPRKSGRRSQGDEGRA